MKYTGRITGLFMMLMAIVAVRIYAYIYLGYSFSNLPVPGVIGLLIAYWCGKQYDRAKFYSEKDVLTGLYNRRFIYEFFPVLLAQMNRKNEKLSVVLLDCDKLKTINDTCGHKQGDLVLQEISALLTAVIRKSDIAARWGGDEFLIVAPYAGERDIKAMINRLKSKLQDVSQQLQIDVSVSSGYAVYPDAASTIDDLIHIADQKMYGFKQQPGVDELYDSR